MTPVLALRLQSLDGNPGILPVKEGQAFIEIDSWNIIKTIRLDNIYNDLILINTKYKEFTILLELNKTFPHDFVNMFMHTNYIRDMTINKYRQLVPQQRFRRGIINPLGSLIKVITGNLDHKDAVKYDKLISAQNKNQVIISKKLTLISKILDSFINTTETIHNNSKIINARLKKVEATLANLTTKADNSLFASYVLGLYSLFISNFRTIFIQLSEIETALAFSRSSILHQSIVNSTELLYHLKLISKYGNLVYSPTESNLIKIEETIKVKSFTKGHQISFIMEVPLVENYTYNYFKLYSLPIFLEPEKKTLAIFPKYPYLLAKGSKYLPIERPCRALTAEDFFLCTEDNKAMYTELTCVEQLMKFDKNLSCCHQHQIQIEDVRMQRINPENWILFTKQQITIIKQCNVEISHYPVKGTYLITLDEPCELKIQGIHISSHIAYEESNRVAPLPVINLPLLRATTSTNAALSSARVLNMNDVNLDEIKYMSRVLQQSEVIDSAALRENDSTFRILFYITFSLISLIFLVILMYFYKKKIVSYIQNYRKSSVDENPDNFALREGGVMVPPGPHSNQSALA